jgi:hypothetical protein
LLGNAIATQALLGGRNVSRIIYRINSQSQALHPSGFPSQAWEPEDSVAGAVPSDFLRIHQIGLKKQGAFYAPHYGA